MLSTSAFFNKRRGLNRCQKLRCAPGRLDANQTLENPFKNAHIKVNQSRSRPCFQPEIESVKSVDFGISYHGLRGWHGLRKGVRLGVKLVKNLDHLGSPTLKRMKDN
jgi:hypothetical protein